MPVLHLSWLVCSHHHLDCRSSAKLLCNINAWEFRLHWKEIILMSCDNDRNVTRSLPEIVKMTLSEAAEAGDCEGHTHTHKHIFPSDLYPSLLQLLQAQLIGKLLHYEKCLTNRLCSCNWITAAANSHCGDLSACMHTHTHISNCLCMCAYTVYLYAWEAKTCSVSLWTKHVWKTDAIQ